MIYPVKYPKQTSWKIIYNAYEGLEKRAVEFLSAQMGKYLFPQKDAYMVHVLACEKEGATIDKNAVVLGLFSQSETIRRFVSKEELEGKDYFVKVVKNPDNPDCRIVCITANDVQNLYYGAVAFIDNYPLDCAPVHGGLHIPQWIYNYNMAEFAFGERAGVQTRGVWSWAQPIGDYRSYIQEMARLKINQIVLWNDYMPLNAKEVVDYAHSFGIRVIWGYAWGWESNGVAACVEKTVDAAFLNGLKEQAILQYERDCLPTGCDGIYFQSFTELSKEYVGGQLVAKVVTDFVNDTVDALLEKYPNLHIQFGLHATSVKNHLDEIARVDKRVEIVWEDCGTFPYAYEPIVSSEEAFEKTLEFTKKILTLRPGAPTGLIFKGMMTVDWEMFVHQSGPYILGENTPAQIKSHKALLKPIWQMFEAGWLQYGEYALRVVREAVALTGGEVNIAVVNEDGGGITLPMAIFSEMLYNPQREYGEILNKASQRMTGYDQDA